MKYSLVIGDVKYYFSSKIYLEKALTDGKDSAITFADAAVRDGEIIKCRWSLTRIFDALDVGVLDAITTAESLSNYKITNIKGLLLNICDNLGDMPISEEWAERTCAKIMEVIDLPEPTERTTRYLRLTEQLLDAQDANDTALEEALGDELEALWWKMQPEELSFVDVMMNNLLLSRDESRNK